MEHDPQLLRHAPAAGAATPVAAAALATDVLDAVAPAFAAPGTAPSAGHRATAPAAACPALTPDLLGALMPMFLYIDAAGRILAAGPTLEKVCNAGPLAGRALCDLADVTRPRPLRSLAEIAAAGGGRICLALRRPPGTSFRGFALALPQGEMLLNLSFGLGVAEAVRDHRLTDSDFAPTDLTVEMLYLIEAKAAVMGELRGLNLRLEQAHRQAVNQALTDPLTGLANRRALELQLDTAARGAGQGGEPFALAHLDLDFFKQVNDSFGHGAGDLVLTEVARILRDETREEDVIARVGGDEFVLILRGMRDRNIVAQMCTRIIERLQRPIDCDTDEARISGSFGVVLSTDHPRLRGEELLAEADRALYGSKRAGRGRVTLGLPHLPPPMPA